MNPLGSRARAEELARLLEGAVAGPAASTAGLAALAVRLRALSPVLDDLTAPRTDFRSALRQRLVAVATVQGVQPVALPAAASSSQAFERALAWSRTWTAQKRLALGSGAMAAVVALTGVGVASSRSLPGQPFYSLKRASESLQLQLADGDTAKGTKHLEFASTRLREVRALAHGESELTLGGVTGSGNLAAGLAASVQERMTDTLADFDTETNQGRTLLEGVYRRTGKTAPLRVLASFATEQKGRLVSLIPELPATTASAARQSLALVTTVGTTANQLLVIGTCDAQCDPDAGGPELPVEPGPTPGTSASPTTDDDNGVPPCTCGEPSLAPEPSAEPTPTDEPSSSPSPTGTPGPTPDPTGSPSPIVLPTVLPTDLPTILPTLPPLPSLPPLPLPVELPKLPTILPTLTQPWGTEP
ncbi:MAG TPA: DUF5667 domain-containing protein [Mycobacteriales bacterium]|nr:DUF5667 domain-containing protein [Mycobacteriales bacterium]